MSTKTVSKSASSVFATADTDAKDVAALVGAIEYVSTDGTIEWRNFPANLRPADVPGGTLAIRYSRAWLIVRRAWMEANAPKLLVTLPVVDPSKVADGDTVKDATNRAWSKVIQPLRAEGCSWGEISVRCGVPESKVRACYRATGNHKDLGDRIGKGGRFAYDEPEFYLEHRKAEGAHIPTDLKSKPKVEQLLNAKDASGRVVRYTRKLEKQAAEAKAS